MTGKGSPRGQVESHRIGGHSGQQHQWVVPLGRLRRRAVPPKREPPLGAGHGRVVQLVRRADRGLRPLLAVARRGRRGEDPRGGGRGRGRGGGRRRRFRGAVGGEGAEPQRLGRSARGGAHDGRGREVRDGGTGEEGAEAGAVEERHGVGRLESSLSFWRVLFASSPIWFLPPGPRPTDRPTGMCGHLGSGGSMLRRSIPAATLRLTRWVVLPLGLRTARMVAVVGNFPQLQLLEFLKHPPEKMHTVRRFSHSIAYIQRLMPLS